MVPARARTDYNRGVTVDQIHAAIVRSIQTVDPAIRDPGPATALTGEDASLDSIGFLTFLITLEGELGGRVDLAASLQDGALEAEENPFRTVATLTAFIAERLNQPL